MILLDDRTCPHRLGTLTCDRADAHDPDAAGGHTYSASDCPDGKHDDESGDW